MKKIIASIMMTVTVLLIATTTVSASSYTVNKGDNLWLIADENNTTMQNLIDINELDSTIIQPNQIIRIDEEEYYTVEQGDTLSEIGQKLDVTVSQLMKWNNLDSSLILIGQQLVIEDGIKVDANESTVESNPTPSVKPAETKKEVEKAPEKQVKQETKKPVEKKQEEPVKQVAKKQETPVKQETKKEAAKPVEKSSQEPTGKTISVKATAYTAQCAGCSGITYTGVNLNKNPNAKVIAVDPSVIPLGTKVYVEGYGHAIAADIGGAIKGNRIDIHVPTKDEAFSWGVRNVNVTIVE